MGSIYVMLYSLISRARVLWKDHRLRFGFLNKKFAQKNSLTEDERTLIWRPTLKFEILGDNQDQVRIISEKLYVRHGKKVKPYAVYSNDSRYEEIYEGSENYIKEVKTIKSTFSCNFENMNDYPFNCEKCTILMYISNNENKLVNLTSDDKIIADIPKNIKQFKIFGWKSKSGKLFNTSGLNHNDKGYRKYGLAC